MDRKVYPIVDLVLLGTIIGLLLNFGDNRSSTMLAVSGGEPLLQKEEVLKLIKSLKTRTNYTVMLATNGSLVEENFINKANELGLDGIMTSFRHIDDEWHKWYTGGHGIQNTVDTLKLVTKKFKGMAVVSLIPFSCIDMVAFENMCRFLHGINPEFVIRIICPFHDKHEYEECCEKRYHKVEEIVLRYFNHVDRTNYFSNQIKGIRYKIETSGNRMKLVKTHEWEKRKEVTKIG